MLLLNWFSSACIVLTLHSLYVNTTISMLHPNVSRDKDDCLVILWVNYCCMTSEGYTIFNSIQNNFHV